MLLPISISIIVAILLRYVQFPVLCRRINSPDCHPSLILLEVGFIVGHIVILIAPAGLLLPDGRAIWIAATLAGLSLDALTGLGALFVVQVLKNRPDIAPRLVGWRFQRKRARYLGSLGIGIANLKNCTKKAPTAVQVR